jgi:Cell shape-determining protein
LKGFTETKTFRFMLISTVSLLIVLIFTSTVGGSFISSLLGFITAPMQSVSASATENVTEYLNLDQTTMEELKQRYLQLSEENLILRKKLLEYEEMKRENEQLKQLLNISNENKEEETLGDEYLSSAVPSAVIGRDPNDVFYGFSIDKGYIAGVSVGDPVITEKGLVGVVTEVYAMTSAVTTILSQKINIGALSPELEESGVIMSDIMSASSGNVRLMYLKTDTQVEPGTIVCTSGASGMYPKGITIGYVKSIHDSDYDVSKYALIEPYEDIRNVSDVIVITSFPGKNEQNSNMDLTVPGGEGGKNEDAEAGS